MRKFYLCLIGFFIGISGFLLSLFQILSGFKFFFFIIPVIILSVVLSSDKEYFNIDQFIFWLFLYLIISSSFITFDASNTFNVKTIVDYSTNLLDIITIFLFIGIPLLTIFGMIWAFIIGKVSSATKAAAFLAMFIGFTMLSFFLFDIAGMEVFGMTKFVSSFYTEILTFLFESPIEIYEGLDGFLEDTPFVDIDLPEIPSKFKSTGENLDFNVMYNSLTELSYSEIIFTIHDCLPLFASITCIFFALTMLRKDWEVQITKLITNISEASQEKKEPQRFYPNFSYSIILYIIFLLGFSFVVFLSYKNTFGQNPAADYEMIGFLSIYLFMSLIPLIFMLLTNLVYFRETHLFKTIKGTLIGTFGLFIMTRLFFIDTIMSAYATQEDIDVSIAYIVNTFLFVAPSETLFFIIFIPGVIASMILGYSRKKLNEADKAGEIKFTKNFYLIEIDRQIVIHSAIADYYKENQNSISEKRAFANNQENLTALVDIKKEIERYPDEDQIDIKTLFGRGSNFAIFILFGVIGSSFIFASVHWIILFLSTGTDFFLFWLSGLGVIYFSAGCWFIFISMKYGWSAGILVHAFYNTSTLILFLLIGGI